MAASVAGGRIALSAGASLLSQQVSDKNPEATCFIGSIDMKVTEEVLWELCTQVGPVVHVYLPKDRVTGEHQGYGFVEFKTPEDAGYAIKTLNMVKLYGKPIKVAHSQSTEKDSGDVGANLFIGNLDPDVDETLLHTTFSAFGLIVNNPRVMRDPDTGISKGFGFVSFADFEASDTAIDVMDGQYLGGRPISVNYAFKKDSTGMARGERHGTPAERLLAAQKKLNEPESMRPHTMFASGPKQAPQPGIDIAPSSAGMHPSVPPPLGMHPWGAVPYYEPPPPPAGMMQQDIPPPPPPPAGMMQQDIPPPPPPPAA